MYLFPASEFEAQTLGGPQATAVAHDFTVSAAESAPVGASIGKRLFGFTAAFGLLLFLAPMLLLIAVLVRATSKGPALFKQRRTGLNGKVFRIYKFRTMTVM